MKKDIPADVFERSVFLLQPGRPILCTTLNEDGSNHVAPFAWINPVSFNPPRVGLALVCLPKKQHSLENIERTGEFIVNLPDLALAEKLVMASFLTLKGENKFERSGFTALAAKKIKPVAIKECRAHLECKVINITVTGDHSLIIADVLAAYYDEDAFTANLMINLKNYQPTIHLMNYNADPVDPWNLHPGQIHVFAECSGAYTADVPYPDA